MRVGQNPEKELGAVKLPWTTRVVLPVYIPHQNNYFAQSLQVLRLCLESLRLTTGEETCVTVVSNGCSPQIVTQLSMMLDIGWIDELILSRRNLGKVGAIATVLKGANEQILAWSDSDVLFKTGWLDSVAEVFGTFPECGAVTPFPAVHLHWEHTSATTLGAAAARCITRQGIVPAEDLKEYARSVGTPTLFRKEYQQSQWLVQRGMMRACVGAMHFICCIRKDVIRGMPARPCTAALNGKEDSDYLDLPAERLGYWRLSTSRSFVWHMGNSVEPWMVQHLDRLRTGEQRGLQKKISLPKPKRCLVSRLPLQVRVIGARALRHVLEKSVSTTLKRKIGGLLPNRST